MKNIAHCNLFSGENGVTVLDADLNYIEVRMILPDELIETSKTTPIQLLKIDASGTSVIKEFSNIETNEISFDLAEVISGYEAGEFSLQIAGDYTSEEIKFHIGETLDDDFDEIYIDYIQDTFEIVKVTANGGGGGGITGEETDPTVPNHVKNISKSDITNWNNKSEFSGSYDDLKNKPDIPTVPTDVSAFNNDAGYLTSFIEIDPVFEKSAAAGITSDNINAWNKKQEPLVSGTNIKTINGQTILGSGDIVVSDGGSGGTIPEITEDTNIFDLETGIYFVNEGVTLTYASFALGDEGATGTSFPVNTKIILNVAKAIDVEAEFGMVNYMTMGNVEGATYAGGILYGAIQGQVTEEDSMWFGLDPVVMYEDTIYTLANVKETITEDDYHDSIPTTGAVRSYVHKSVGDKVINNVKNFGAVGDGKTDDTEAIQTALNAGGIIYFPNGVYFVSKPLIATTPCKIVMQGCYASSYNKIVDKIDITDRDGDYPLKGENLPFGARIETSAYDSEATEPYYGLLLGDGIEVDGLFIRAKEGFRGEAILKYDGSKGKRSYPSQTRLKHIRVDRYNWTETVDTPTITSFFDFNPDESYGVIVEDVLIGSNHIIQLGHYGFRSSLTSWNSSLRLKDFVIDCATVYPFYINGNGHLTANWVIENVAIQASTFQYTNNNITAHNCLAYLADMHQLYITGCKCWDVDNGDGAADNGKFVDNPAIPVKTNFTGSNKITAIGNDDYFNAIDTVLKEQLTKANELNLANLEVAVKTNDETGANEVTMSDGKREKTFEIPAVSLSDEQIGNSVGKWMTENASPVETIGRNKLNPETIEKGCINTGNGKDLDDTWYVDNYWRSDFIEAETGDTIRLIYVPDSGNNGGRSLSYVLMYDENKTLLGYAKDTDRTTGYVIATENVKYIRISVTVNENYGVPFGNVATRCMITINDTDVTYEPYQIILKGGIGQYIVLASPNGTYYTLSVDNEGNISAEAVN